MFYHLLPALRLKTLPLAISAIAVGTALAVADDAWQPLTFVLTMLSALALQILSNIANDYGDGIKGTDAHQVQAQPDGLTKRVTVNHPETYAIMRKLLWAWGVLTFFLGAALSIVATQTVVDFVIFFVLGLLSIGASITYTIGKRAYGYYGLGDASVFLFFGLIGVLGSYYLQAHQMNWYLVLPAVSVGALCVAVLNINNLRDLETDKQSGKHTFALCLGMVKAKHYHALLVTIGFVGFISISIAAGSFFSWMYICTMPLFVLQSMRIYRAQTSTQLGKELPKCVQYTFVCCLLFAIGNILS